MAMNTLNRKESAVRTAISLLLGTVVAFVVGALLGTQMVLASVQSMGLDVTLTMRWASSLQDLVGLSSSLLPLMAIALVPSWLILDWLSRRSILKVNMLWYALVGAASIGVLHPLLNVTLGVDVFAPARSWYGLFGQALAGGIGGLTVVRVRGDRATT